jgi:glycosyltransferase involved in cell wall biosynthesis
MGLRFESLSAHKSQYSVTKAFEIDLNIVVVIPCYNVEKTIASVVAGIPSYVRCVVLVDDASRDRTAEIVDSLKSERIRVIHPPENRGVGGATMRGYEEALALGADVIVKMDGDGQMDPAYLIPLIAPILMNQADYTKGNRFLHADQIKSMPLIRRIGNAGLSFLTKAASGYWDIFDPTNGYTAIHASIVPLLDTNKLHRRYFYESSMLIQLGMIRAVIQDVEIPAKYQDEVSSLSEWKALFEFPPRLLAGFLRRLLVQYFVRDFGVFSMLLVSGLGFSAFGLFFGLYHWYLSAITTAIASTGTVMIAVLPLILGAQLLIQSMIVDMQNIPSEPLHTNLDVLEKIQKSLEQQT